MDVRLRKGVELTAPVAVLNVRMVPPCSTTYRVLGSPGADVPKSGCEKPPATRVEKSGWAGADDAARVRMRPAIRAELNWRIIVLIFRKSGHEGWAKAEPVLPRRE